VYSLSSVLEHSSLSIFTNLYKCENKGILKDPKIIILHTNFNMLRSRSDYLNIKVTQP
jgi:hypothetical protein